MAAGTGNSTDRAFGDRVGELYGTVQTTDATVTTILAIDIEDVTSCAIDIQVSARNSADRAGFLRQAVVFRQGGGATLEGLVNLLWTLLSAGAGLWAVTVTTSVNQALVRVTGVAATTIDWSCYARVVVSP